ncbi:MAG: hypothetical protein EOO41_00760, partial [Methanobacteriota archaeon]
MKHYTRAREVDAVAAFPDASVGGGADTGVDAGVSALDPCTNPLPRCCVYDTCPLLEPLLPP